MSSVIPSVIPSVAAKTWTDLMILPSDRCYEFVD
jgi:hypothetical protein